MAAGLANSALGPPDLGKVGAGGKQQKNRQGADHGREISRGRRPGKGASLSRFRQLVAAAGCRARSQRPKEGDEARPAARQCAGLMKVPLRNSAMACRISACVFITMGPCQATGSWIGAPEISRKRTPSRSGLHRHLIARAELHQRAVARHVADIHLFAAHLFFQQHTARAAGIAEVALSLQRHRQRHDGGCRP